MWKTMVDENIDDCTAVVRISDNMLCDGDWKEDIIVFRTGIIVSQTPFKEGAYGAPNMVGWSTYQFKKWLAEDWGGYSPENYNEYRIII